MNAARFTISGQLLAELLRMPSGTRVVRVRESPDIVYGQADIEVMVEHESLPPIEMGQIVPVVHPLYHSKDGVISMVSWDK